MPVIQVIPDRFKENEKSLLGSIQSGNNDSIPHIRRPTRGIQIKEDSFATLRVVAGTGKPVPLIDAGSRRKVGNQFIEVDGKRATDIYSNFFIQSVTEERAEKQQILETFGEPYIFLFGERARMMTFTGVLVNTFDFNWEAEWWHNYENYMRGTKCVENDARVFLSFDETLVTGYITASAASKNAQEKNFVNFQFQMFITSNVNFSKVGSPYALPGIQEGQGGVGSGFLEETITPEGLSPFRPTLIDTATQTGRLPSTTLGNAGIEPGSLADGLVNGLRTITNTFNNIQSQINTVIQSLSQIANGTIVRVPIGFAGVMEFNDDVDITKLVEVTQSGKIRYSTFDQNSDEYVGVSDHYGSSVSKSGVLRLDPDVSKVLKRDQEMVDEAARIWREAGFTIPPEQLQVVSALFLKTGYGLITAGASAAWQNQKLDVIDTLQGASGLRPTNAINSLFEG